MQLCALPNAKVQLLLQIQLVDKGLARNASSSSAALERSISRTPSPSGRKFNLRDRLPKRREENDDDNSMPECVRPPACFAVPPAMSAHHPLDHPGVVDSPAPRLWHRLAENTCAQAAQQLDMLWALCSSSDEEQDDVLEGVSDGGSTATSLPNDGGLEESTTPNAPAQSHKGLLYCQVSLELQPVLGTQRFHAPCGAV